MLSLHYRRTATGRSSRVAYGVVLAVGVLFGLSAEEIGDVVARFPVESVLIAIMAAGVVTLAWSALQLLRDAARRADEIFDEELRRPRTRRRPAGE